MGARAFVIAVDFGGTKIDVATAALSGEIIGQVRLDTLATRGAEQAVDRAIEAAWLLIGVAEDEPGGICVAAGVVCPGIPLADRVALAPKVAHWMNWPCTWGTWPGCSTLSGSPSAAD